MSFDESEKRICLIKFQESVIIRGVEKKLVEKNFEVVSFDSEQKDEIKKEYKKADLFIAYIPPDVREDTSSFSKTLEGILTSVSAEDKKVIVIGDDDDRNAVSENIPAMWSHIWISRPLDIKKLFYEIREELQDENDGMTDKHILIVDDDPSYAKIVRGWLGDDYKVDIVTAGMQAITFLSRKKVDLILLDYEMPITDGPQVLGMLRQEPTLSEIPVIFLTGVDSKEAVSRAAHLKPDGYILKSTSRGDLMMYVKGVLKKYQDRVKEDINDEQW